MRLLISKYFILHLGVYLIFRLMRYLEVSMPELVTSYLADLCAMPVILVLILFCLRKLRRNECFELTSLQVFSVVVYMGVLLEFVFPQIFHYMISDPLDLAAYLLGALSYILWRKEERKPVITA